MQDLNHELFSEAVAKGTDLLECGVVPRQTRAGERLNKSASLKSQPAPSPPKRKEATHGYMV